MVAVARGFLKSRASADTWFPQILSVGISGQHAGAALIERSMIWTTVTLKQPWN